MSFSTPWVLLLLVIPVLLGVWEWVRDTHAIPMPFDYAQQRKRDILYGLIVRCVHLIPAVILALVITIFAGPRRTGPPESDRVMANILFLFDLSGSMCEGFGPNAQPPKSVSISGINTFLFEEDVYTRYHAANEAMNEFASYRAGDAFGLTFFGTEYIHWLPVTQDVKALKTSARLLHPNSMPRWFAGTRIANALRGCITKMKEQPTGDRLLIVITDGESQDFINNAEIAVATELRDANITTYFIAIDPKLKMESMRTIAAMTGGEAMICGDKEGLRRIFRHIDKMEKAKMKQATPGMVDFYAPFAVAIFVLGGFATITLFGLRFTPW